MRQTPKKSTFERAPRLSLDTLFLLRRICRVSLACVVLASTITGQTSKSGRGVVEGTVQSHGEPVRKAEIVVFGSPYTVDNSFVVPIITPRLVGAISYNAPPTTLQVYYVAKTDKKGHYRIDLSASRYELRVTPLGNKDHTISRIATIEKGKKLSLDFDLSAKWGQAEQSSEEFVQILNQVVAAAKELRPMRSILFTPVGDDTSLWIPTIILPGADDCHIVGLNSIKMNGQSVTLPMYSCSAKYETQEAATAAYREMITFITERMGWKAEPGERANVTKFGVSNLPSGDEVTLGVSTDANVNFVYTTLKRTQPSDSQFNSQVPANPDQDNTQTPRQNSNATVKDLTETAVAGSGQTSVNNSDPAALVLTVKAAACIKHCRGQLTLQKTGVTFASESGKRDLHFDVADIKTLTKEYLIPCCWVHFFVDQGKGKPADIAFSTNEREADRIFSFATNVWRMSRTW